jgi:hypothetical protein
MKEEDAKITIEEFMDRALKELQKHAERDGCYDCKQLMNYKFVQQFLKRHEVSP